MSDTELKSRVLVLVESLRRLQQLKGYSEQEFLADFKISDAALRNLQISIEALTDIANYLLKRAGIEIPTTRTRVFEKLCESGILDDSLRDKLVQMARFRDLLVHGYAAIDLRRVHKILREETPFLESAAETLMESTEQ